MGRLIRAAPGLFLVFGGLAFYMSVTLPFYLYTDHREEQLVRDGATVSGTVASAQPACHDQWQSVEVSYKAEGKDYRLDANTDPAVESSLFVGQSVDVRYDPASPERSRLRTLGDSDAGFFRFMLIFGPIFFGILADWLLIKNLLRLLRSSRPPRPSESLDPPT